MEEIRSTAAVCSQCIGLVPFKIKDRKGKKYAYCMYCGRRVYVPEVEAYNANKEKEEK